MTLKEEETALLLYINEAIAAIRDKNTLFKTVIDKLRLIFKFETATISVYDFEAGYSRLFVRDFSTNEALANTDANTMYPIEGSPVKEFIAYPVAQVIDFEELANRYEDFPPLKASHMAGIKELAIAPLRYGGELIGILILGASSKGNFSAADTMLLGKVAAQVAIAVSNALAYEDINEREREKSLQLAVNNALLQIKERDKMFVSVATEIDKVVPCGFFGIRIRKNAGETVALANYPKDENGKFVSTGDILKSAGSDVVAMHLEAFEVYESPKLYVGEAFENFCERFRIGRYIHETFGIQSLLYVPLWTDADGREPHNATQAVVVLADKRPMRFSERDKQLVQNLAPQISLALQNLFAFEEIETLRRQLEQEKLYLEDEIKTTANFDEIIGTSPKMQALFKRMNQVAATDSTVLIQGETGTGKELVARAVHNLSPRKDRPLIKLNCAALPAQLIESELFGHEKGSFTGAIERRIGKFELARHGTIFLDEIGELPMELQAKLLRVLQEKEFERLGGREVLKADVRIIAATNRDLETEVAAGRFRADLYFRLNVFPLDVPPLRERPEDVPMLAQHFIRKFSRQMGKPVRGIKEKDMQDMQSHAWPGNIRELEHTLEQVIITSAGSTLDLSGFFKSKPNGELKAGTTDDGMIRNADEPVTIKPLRMMERDYILAALKQTNGRVHGPNGAAALLEINSKTLESRMKKLGIQTKRIAI
jgi:formate hydrogenlyase transcriptional activator